MNWTQQKMITNSDAIHDIIFYGPRIYLTNDNMTASVVATISGDYIIFMNNENETMYALDTNSEVIGKCNIKFFYCEDRFTCYLTITRDEYVDGVSVCGWIRKVGWIEKLPFPIQKMISNNVCNEMLHVVEFMKGDHWEISVDNIIQSLENV